MSYRVSSISRRIYFTGLSGLGLLAVLSVIFSDPNGTQPASIALMSVLLAWLIALGIRGWRCATLLASGHQVTIRGLVTTTSVHGRHIDRFVADTRPAPVMTGLPIRIRRTVLGIKLRSGQTRWFPELSCRPAGDASSWVDVSVTRLNEMLAVHSASQDGPR